MNILKDITTGKTYKIHICNQCDKDQYPEGKPILPEDKLAAPNDKGEWICGPCQIEELNKRKMRVWGSDHKDVKAFIQKEDNDCKRWNNYAKRVNQTMGAGLNHEIREMLLNHDTELDRNYPRPSEDKVLAEYDARLKPSS